MTIARNVVLALILMGLLAAFWVAAVSAQGEKQIMIVVSTDDDGELNPCG
jgi:hypothetical protein